MCLSTCCHLLLWTKGVVQLLSTITSQSKAGALWEYLIVIATTISKPYCYWTYGQARVPPCPLERPSALSESRRAARGKLQVAQSRAEVVCSREGCCSVGLSSATSGPFSRSALLGEDGHEHVAGRFKMAGLCSIYGSVYIGSVYGSVTI